jgi:hypothetical protein
MSSGGGRAFEHVDDFVDHQQPPAIRVRMGRKSVA